MKICTECKILGLNSNGDRIMKCKFICDTYADIPTATEFQQSTGCIISMGSEAHIIFDNSDYELQSSGSWTLSQAGSASYTKAEVDQLLSAKADASSVYTKAEVDAIAAEIDYFSEGTEIPANSDLNSTTYRTPGVYRIGATNAATLSNCPTSQGFRMEVVRIAFSTISQQRIYPQSRSADSFFVRTGGFVSNVYTWGNWYQYTGTQV